jgi:HAD superfamily hydrolase (TIGR01458 family)
MTPATDRDAALAPGSASTLAGVRGLLLDLDGVLVLRRRLLPGAREALARLDGAGFPYLVATNMSLVCRATLSDELARGGLAIPPERLLTASSAAAGYCARRFEGERLLVMAAKDALREFEGQRLVSYEQAARADDVAAVVVGDAGEDFSSRHMQLAFRLLRDGAGFVAMHKNRWWLTPEGVLLDSGAYVTALEFGLERRAVVTGKPAAAFFREGLRRLEAIGGGRLAPAEVAMVGDDLWNDIRGAQRAGLRGAFVRSGKHGDAELTRLGAERHGRMPDAVEPSIVEIVEALLRGRSAWRNP